MMMVTVGLDIAKQIFQVHGIDRTGKVVGCAFYRRANEKVLLVRPIFVQARALV